MEIFMNIFGIILSIILILELIAVLIAMWWFTIDDLKEHIDEIKERKNNKNKEEN